MRINNPLRRILPRRKRSPHELIKSPWTLLGPARPMGWQFGDQIKADVGVCLLAEVYGAPVGRRELITMAVVELVADRHAARRAKETVDERQA